MNKLCNKYNPLRMCLFIGITVIMFLSCTGGEELGKNPYCEFVDGNYTFDLDLRRSIFYMGKDFKYIYYNTQMEECRVDEASYVKLMALGNFFDESIYEEEDANLFYSSIIKLPKENYINECTINILTTLETERIIYLVKSGYNYDESKKLAGEEIWRQLKESELFEHYDFLNVQAFEHLNIGDDCLKSITSYFSKLIIQATELSEDNSIYSDVLYDFIENYAMSGNLELSSLNKDFFSNIDTEIIPANSQEMLLKYSVAYYSMPFDGGIPYINESKIYYGIDTSTYNNKLLFTEKEDLKLSYPKYQDFICNGYVNISGTLNIDSVKTKRCLEVIVKDINEKRTYYSNTINVDSEKPFFATTIWLMKEGEYKIVVKYGAKEIILNTVNQLSFNRKEEEQN